MIHRPAASNQPPMPPQELAELADRYLRGELASDQLTTMEQELLRHPASRDRFVKYINQACMIREVLQSRRSAASESLTIDDQIAPFLWDVVEQERAAANRRRQEQAQKKQHQQAEALARRKRLELMWGADEPVKPIKHYVIPRAVFYGAIATVAAMLLLLILPMFETRPVATAPTNGPALAPEPQFVQVAVLAEQIDAHWLVPGNIPGSHPPAPGDALLNQKMYLVSGLAKIRFNNEAEVILEAPCSIEPISEDEIKITHGKLVGRCKTKTSQGFVVRTNSAVITDLGTEFAVLSKKYGDSEVHVFDGLVEIDLPDSPRNGARPRRVSAGHAIAVGPSGRDSIRSVKLGRGVFYDHLPSQYELAVRRSLPAGYWRFNLANGLQSLRNFGQVDAAAVVFGKHTDFMSPGVGGGSDDAAIAFGSDGYGVIQHSGEFNYTNSFTLEAWLDISDLKIEPPIARVLSNLQSSDTGRKGGYGLGVAAGRPDLQVPENALVFTFFGACDVYTKIPLPSTRWVHVVAVIDGSGEVSLYIDGVKREVAVAAIYQSRYPSPGKSSEMPVVVGRIAEPDSNAIFKHGEQFSSGVIDELVFYDHVLSAKEIYNHYLVGADVHQ